MWHRGFSTWGIQTGPFAALWANFVPQIFQLLYWGSILIAPERGWLKVGKWNSSNLRAREEFLCLGHSNWTICNLLSQFCSINFPTFSLLYWGPILITPESGGLKKGKMEFSQPKCERWISVPGAFKLDHLQPVEPILFCIFSNFAPSYWRANSYYPREGKTEKRKMELSQLESESGISVPGAFKLDHLQPIKPMFFPKFSNFFTFIQGGQFLLPQRGDDWKWKLEFSQPEF